MTAVMTPSSFTTLDHHHHSRSRRRECLGLVTSMRMSMDLSMKAVSVVLCCVMMTLPASSFNKGKRKPTPHDDITDTDSTSSFTTSTSTEPPHKRARTSPSLSAQQSEYFLCCHYRTLMIESDAEVVDIKKAHRKMAVRYHPDKNADASAQEMFVRIQEAYETLSDPIKRHTYDTKMRHHIHQHHSTPLTHDDTADEPAYDIFGRKKSLSRRSRLARYIFSSRSQPTSSSLVKTSPISSAIFALVCAALFVCVVLPSFVIMLVSGMVLSLSTATYRLLRSSQYTSVPARMNN